MREYMDFMPASRRVSFEPMVVSYPPSRVVCPVVLAGAVGRPAADHHDVVRDHVQLNQYIEDSLVEDLAHVDEVYFGRKEAPKGNFWVITEATQGAHTSHYPRSFLLKQASVLVALSLSLSLIIIITSSRGLMGSLPL
jgi:hypothetical protein